MTILAMMMMNTYTLGKRFRKYFSLSSGIINHHTSPRATKGIIKNNAT